MFSADLLDNQLTVDCVYSASDRSFKGAMLSVLMHRYIHAYQYAHMYYIHKCIYLFVWNFDTFLKCFCQCFLMSDDL